MARLANTLRLETDGAPERPQWSRRLSTMAVVLALMAVACGGAEQVTAIEFDEPTEPTSRIETTAPSPMQSDRVAAPKDQPPITALPAGDVLQATLDAGVIEHGGKGFTFAVILPDGQRWVGVTGVSHGTIGVTPDMLFAAGSITKTWTATTIMQLAEEGVLSLDDSVCEWLPEVPNVDCSITLRQRLRTRPSPAAWERRSSRLPRISPNGRVPSTTSRPCSQRTRLQR